MQGAGQGPGGIPWAAVGRAYFTADGAQRGRPTGERVVLVRRETSPEDVHGILVAEGILTSRGGLVTTPPWSPAVGASPPWSGPSRCASRATFRVGDTEVHEGD